MGTVNGLLLSFSVTIFFLQGTEAVDCPKAWRSYQDFCIGVIDTEVSWADAEVECQGKGLGGHLASVLGPKEMIMMASTIKGTYPHVKNLWIGLHDPRNTGRWEWSDSNPFNFKIWSVTARKTKGHCGYLSAKSGFKEFERGCCQKPMAYLCKSMM